MIWPMTQGIASAFAKATADAQPWAVFFGAFSPSKQGVGRESMGTDIGITRVSKPAGHGAHGVTRPTLRWG